MIARIRGILIEKATSEVIVECAGVGYLVMVSVRTSEKLPELEQEVTLFIHHVVREDASDLFGFLQKSEKQAFQKLISVSGIGPKSAIGILSAADIKELHNLITTENHKALNKLPGIGKKTAERLVVELKDKFADIQVEGEPLAYGSFDVNQEAVAALVSLGYNKLKAERSVKKAVDECNESSPKIEKIIKLALKYAIA